MVILDKFTTHIFGKTNTVIVIGVLTSVGLVLQFQSSTAGATTELNQLTPPSINPFIKSR